MRFFIILFGSSSVLTSVFEGHVVVQWAIELLAYFIGFAYLRLRLSGALEALEEPEAPSYQDWDPRSPWFVDPDRAKPPRSDRDSMSPGPWT